MKELELVDIDMKDGCLTGAFETIDQSAKSYSLILKNKNTQASYPLEIMVKERIIHFNFNLKEVKEMEIKTPAHYDVLVRTDKAYYRLTVRMKHLKEKLKYACSPQLLHGSQEILASVKRNRLCLTIGDTRLLSESKNNLSKKVIRDLSIDIEKKAISFKLINCTCNHDVLKIVLVERKSKLEWIEKIQVIAESNDIDVQINLSEFVTQHYNQFSRWDLYIEDECSDRYRIGTYDVKFGPKYERYLAELPTLGVNVLVPYITDYNGLSIVIGDPTTIRSEKLNIKAKVKKFHMHGSTIKGKVVLDFKEVSSLASVKSLVLQYRSKVDSIKYEFPLERIKERGSDRIVYFNIDIAQLELENYYWDFYIAVEFMGMEYLVRLRNPSKRVKWRVNKQFSKQEYHYSNGYWVYPYITGVNTLALLYKEEERYESLSYRLKERAALMTYWLLKWYFDRKNIWLSFEKFANSAQDNAFYFFEYCYNHQVNRQLYFIIKEDSPDYENIRPMQSQVLHHMSFKYMVYLYAAKVLVSSESKAHAYDIRAQKGLLKKAISNKKHVFLQHGVLGLKKVDYIYKKTSKNAVDLFVVSSDYEKSIVKNNFGYNEDEIIVTGLSRWDVLEDQSNGQSTILIMPTWRSWMDDLPEEKFVQTEYYQQYKSLLNSTPLFDILEEYDVKLNFFIHPKFKAYINQFKTEHERVTIYEFGEVKLNELLMKSSMLITDYSSVAWDMYYQHKPILFYQFDFEDYMKYQGSYIDMETQLFGDRAFRVNRLIELIEEYARHDFKEKEEYAALRKEYLAYTDHENSKRIIQEIRKRNIG